MKKLYRLCAAGCLLITLLTSSAVAINCPKYIITDEIGDVTGSLAFLLPQNLWKFLDIKCAWLYEEYTEPDYIYASIKFTDLTLRRWHTIYSFFWEYNGKICVANVHLGLNGAASDFYVNYGDNRVKVNDGIIDTENDIITFIVPKALVGNPKPGDLLTNTQVISGMRPFQKDRFILMLIFAEIGKDYAGIGSNYIVQY